MSAATVPGFAVLLAATLAHTGVASLLFLRRRTIFPMSGHCVGLVAIIVVGIMLHGVLGAISGMVNGEISCMLLVSGAYLGVFSYITGIMVRAWRVWFYYEFATEKANATIDKRSRWFARHRHLFTNRRLCIFTLFGIFFAWIGPVIVFVYVEPDVFGAIPPPGISFCASMAISRRFLQGLVAVTMSLLFVAIWKLRRISDGYYMKRDLGVSACVAVVSLTSAQLEPLIGASPVRALAGIGLNVVVFAVVTWKVILSYQIPRMRAQAQSIRLKRKTPGSRSTSRSTSISFKDVLDDSEMLSLFTEHLKREFSVENLLFYRRVCEFDNACQTGQLNATERNIEAAGIYAAFVSHDGDLQVNLQSKIIENIKAELERCIGDFSVASFLSNRSAVYLHTVSSEIFERAKRSIFALMESDTFVRFKMNLTRLERARLSRFETLSRATGARKAPTRGVLGTDPSTATGGSHKGTALGGSPSPSESSVSASYSMQSKSQTQVPVVPGHVSDTSVSLDGDKSGYHKHKQPKHPYERRTSTPVSSSGERSAPAESKDDDYPDTQEPLQV